MLNNLHKHYLKTPLGILLATASEHALLGLEFTEIPSHKQSPPSCHPIKSIIQELDDYFAGNLKKFKTAISLQGTEFQTQTWQALLDIPYGKTISYAQLAANLGKPTAFRAAANANGKNKFVILVPCHRVITSAGTLGGYSSGLERKKWLLKHEGINNVSE